jgi:hypothetical protein
MGMRRIMNGGPGPHALSGTAAISAALVFLLVTPLEAQRFTGRVVDAASADGIGLARVELLDADGRFLHVVAADTAGFFVLDARRPGSYRLRVSSLGYAPYESPRIDLRSAETFTADIRLSAAGIPLEPLVVRARGGEERGRFGFERRCALGTGVCLTEDSIWARHPRLVSDALHSVPGVQVWEMHGRISVFSMRGGKCFMMFRDHWPIGILAGVRPDLRQPQFPDRPPEDVRCPQGNVNCYFGIEGVRGIEIYRDITEVPRELRDVRFIDLWPIGSGTRGNRLWGREPCGLIWIWTDHGW